MSKNQIIIALVVLCLLGTIWGAVKGKKASSLERQLVAMQQQPAVSVVDETAMKKEKEAVKGKVKAVVKDLKAQKAVVRKLQAQNKELVANAATLEGSIASQKDEISKLNTELKSSDGEKAVKAIKKQLNKKAAQVAKLEKAVVAAKAALDGKNVALAAAEKTVAGFEDMKATLANSVDSYSAKSQALAVEVDEHRAQTAKLAKVLEDQTKLLVIGGEELARTKLNMNILLAKIAAQNNSLSILEETRVTQEKELATMLKVIEELQHQLSAQVIVDPVIVEDAPAKEAAPAN